MIYQSTKLFKCTKTLAVLFASLFFTLSFIMVISCADATMPTVKTPTVKTPDVITPPDVVTPPDVITPPAPVGTPPTVKLKVTHTNIGRAPNYIKVEIGSESLELGTKSGRNTAGYFIGDTLADAQVATYDAADTVTPGIANNTIGTATITVSAGTNHQVGLSFETRPTFVAGETFLVAEFYMPKQAIVGTAGAVNLLDSPLNSHAGTGVTSDFEALFLPQTTNPSTIYFYYHAIEVITLASVAAGGLLGSSSRLTITLNNFMFEHNKTYIITVDCVNPIPTNLLIHTYTLNLTVAEE